jgi:tryptophan-rich sensory protein
MEYNKKWYKKLKKAPLTPPNWIFGTVWPILYLLMFISCFIIWSDETCKPYCNELNPFWIQLLLNLCWTTIFFRYKQLKFAFLTILAILYYTYTTYIKFVKINSVAGYLLLPYFIWLCFAGYLNLYIIYFN